MGFDFARIDSLKNELRAMRPLGGGELRRLRDEFIVENTYDSNAIEGGSLTLWETALILREGVTIAEKPLRDHLEAIGHRDAFEYILGLVDGGAGGAELTEGIIKKIHSLVLMSDAASRGEYRRIPVAITGAAHTPPQPYLVPVQMERLVADYAEMKRGAHIIEAVSEFHLRFEGIHPFIDGNGRVGRLILNLELIGAGLLPVNIKFADRGAYCGCFDEYFGEAGAGVEALSRIIAGYEVLELERYIGVLKSIF